MIASVRERSASAPRSRASAGLGTGLTIGTFLVALAFSYGDDALPMSLTASLLASAAAAATVWLSGVRPLLAMVLVLVLALTLPMMDTTFTALRIVVVVVVFRAALGTDLRPWALAIFSLVALTVDDAAHRDALGESLASPTVLYPVLLTALAVGLGVQSRRVQRQHSELVALRESDRRRAASDERRRIGRDLHDVAAHHLPALVVHNKLAVRLDTPQALQEAADFTARTAAETLDSLRQVVHVLATERDAPLAPSPRLSDLEEVVARMRAAGLDVVEQEAGPVPTPSREVELALVRIAQEALANVLRHRGPGRAWLAVTRRGDHVALTVEDDGPAPPRAEITDGLGGYGLIGMRERAEACGGHLEVGSSRHGGWRVSAVLPSTTA